MSLYNDLNENFVSKSKWLSRFNFQLFYLISALIGASLINFYSITHTTQISSLFWTQLMWISLGFVVFFILSFLDYKIFCRFSYFIYGINILSLILVLFFGKNFNGAQRWFDLSLFSYQPSETTKLALICILAHLLAKKSMQFEYGFKQIIGIAFLIILPFVLIVMQPDLGTALLIGIQCFSVLCFVKIGRNLLISSFAILIVIIPTMWNFVLKDYQKNRVLMFISSDKDPYGAGYNTIQSNIAVGSGQLIGKGFKKGTQAQFKFLPERHTDFVFSVFSEEHGFFGSLILLSFYLFLLLSIFKIAMQARDKEGVYLCLGAASIIFWHMFINISMAIGILPVVGVPLPLFSYGGSNMLTIFIALGLVSSVSSSRYIYS